MEKRQEREKSPRFRPEPTRLTREGIALLETLRLQKVPYHEDRRRDGFVPVGSLSEYDRFILRDGKNLTIQAARQDAGDRVRALLEERYLRRGRNVEVCFEKGAVLLKGRRRQKGVSGEADFTLHAHGLTFYMRERPLSLGVAHVRVSLPHASVVRREEFAVLAPRVLYTASLS